MGAGSRLDADANNPVAHFDGVGARSLVADEAGAGGEVERPGVVGAGQVAADDVSLDQRVSFVRAGVGDGVDVPVHVEHRDLVPLVLHERAAVGLELIERDREPVGHS